MERWERFRNQYPENPPLLVQNIEKIAGDMEFVFSYLKNDLLLSDQEFVHDHSAHITRTLEFICAHGAAAYEKKQAYLRAIIEPPYKKIAAARQNKELLKITEEELLYCETLLAILTDAAFAQNHDSWEFCNGEIVKAPYEKNATESLPKAIWNSNQNVIFLKRRLGDMCALIKLQEAWNKVILPPQAT